MKGYSLVEILVATALLALVVSGALAVLVVSDKSWNAGSELLDTQQQARLAMDRMSRELRQARSEGILRIMTVSNLGKKITYYIPGFVNPVSYNLEGSSITREYPPGTKTFIANNIDKLAFCCWHDDVCDTNCPAQAPFSSQVQVQLLAKKSLGSNNYYFPDPQRLEDGTVKNELYFTEQVKIRNQAGRPGSLD